MPVYDRDGVCRAASLVKQQSTGGNHEDIEHSVTGFRILLEEVFNEHVGCAEVLTLAGELVPMRTLEREMRLHRISSTRHCASISFGSP